MCWFQLLENCLLCPTVSLSTHTHTHTHTHTPTHICILLLLNSFFHVLVFCNMELYNLHMFPLISPLHSQRASQMALVVKNLPANAGDIRDLGSIPGSGRSPGGGHGNPLQYSCLENPMDRGAWWFAVHRVEHDWSNLPHTHLLHSHIVTALHNKEVSFREVKWQNWDQEEIFSLWTCPLSSLLAAEVKNFVLSCSSH